MRSQRPAWSGRDAGVECPALCWSCLRPLPSADRRRFPLRAQGRFKVPVALRCVASVVRESLVLPPASSPSLRSSRSPSRSGGSREAASRWHRFTLAPGVELQISDSVSVPPPGARRMAWLNRLIARLLEQLEDTPP